MGRLCAGPLNIGQIASKQGFWLRVPVAGMQLVEAGSDRAIILARISKWRGQGDNQTERPMHLRLVSPVARR